MHHDARFLCLPCRMHVLQEIFKYIGRYNPGPVEQLPMRLMPFIPEYIPAIGSTDEFIKVPRPDGQPDFLGLKVGLRAAQGPWCMWRGNQSWYVAAVVVLDAFLQRGPPAESRVSTSPRQVDGET